MKKFKKTTQDIVGGSLMLGAGGAMLGSFEGISGVPGNLASKTIGTSATMMGAMIPAAYGSQIMGMFKQHESKKKKQKWY